MKLKTLAVLHAVAVFAMVGCNGSPSPVDTEMAEGVTSEALRTDPIQVTSGTGAFGTDPLGIRARLMLALSNRSDASVRITQVGIGTFPPDPCIPHVACTTAPSGSPFAAVLLDPPSDFAPNTSTPLELDFTPTARGAASDVVVVEYVDRAGASYTLTVPVSGVGR